MTLKFYFDLLSQPSRAIYVFLKHNKIPFEKKVVNLGSGEHLKEEYKRINPLSLIPAIDDNGFIVRESVGILRYLCREKEVADHWYPKESKAQARADEFIEWQHLGFRLPLAMYFRILFLEPKRTGKEPLESDIKRYKNLMKLGCDKMEDIWLAGDKKFLFGNQISIADLLACMELEQLRLTDYDPKDGRPRIATLLENVRAETHPYYDEANRFFDVLTKNKP